MVDTVNYRTVQTYAAFNNVDKSILATNRFIEKFGYKFVCIGLSELEEKFSDLFSLPKNFKSESKVLVQGPDFSISDEFYESLTNNPAFGHSVLQDKHVIFLQRIEDFDQEVINNIVDIEYVIKVGGEFQGFVAALIQQFRLFKNGDIDCSMQFQILKENRKVISRLTGRLGKSYGRSIYSLFEKDIELLSLAFNGSFLSNPLTELALNSFNLSYEIADTKTKYVTLMTCLECLFNHGTGQITHTVSRHLAIIVSKSETEFQSNYYRVKKLYELRSAIVHGGTTKEDLAKASDELQNKVRHAINYCLKLQLNKTQLFDKLNTFGFLRDPL